MTDERVTIVVGEGRSARQGLLRFVLEGEGYEVVGEAASAAELARVLSMHTPDLVVLDDGINATAVGMVHEMLPSSKVILVWPSAVVPIGGDARVETSQVLRELGGTVERLTGVKAQSGLAGASEAPARPTRTREESATLRDILRGAKPPPAEPTEPIIVDREPAPVVILPVTPAVGVDAGELTEPVEPAASGAEDEPPEEQPAAGVVAPVSLAEILAGGEPEATTPEDAAEDAPAEGEPKEDEEEGRKGVAAAAVGTAAAAVGTAAAAVGTAAATTGAVASGATPAAAEAAGTARAAELNRRLGSIALGGAAAAGALVLALAVGGSRVPVAGVSAEPPTIPPPTTVPPPTAPPTTPPGNDGGGPNNGGGPGNDGRPRGGIPQGDFYPLPVGSLLPDVSADPLPGGNGAGGGQGGAGGGGGQGGAGNGGGGAGAGGSKDGGSGDESPKAGTGGGSANEPGDDPRDEPGNLSGKVGGKSQGRVQRGRSGGGRGSGDVGDSGANGLDNGNGKGIGHQKHDDHHKGVGNGHRKYD